MMPLKSRKSLDDDNYYKNMNRFIFPSVLKAKEILINKYESDLHLFHQGFLKKIANFYNITTKGKDNIKTHLLVLAGFLFFVCVFTLTISNIAETITIPDSTTQNFGSAEAKVNRNFYFLLLFNLVFLVTETVWLIQISKNFKFFKK